MSFKQHYKKAFVGDKLRKMLRLSALFKSNKKLLSSLILCHMTKSTYFLFKDQLKEARASIDSKIAGLQKK
jgi:ACT domain-containing protein